MSRFNLTERAIRRCSLATYVTLVIMVAGGGSYLWFVRSKDPKFILQAIGAVLGVSLAAEEVIRLSSPSRSLRRDERRRDA
jgi:hypothetical protein